MASTHQRLFLIAAMGCVVLQSVGAMDHIVGAGFGWSIPENTTYYQDWAKSKNFSVGDNLVFLFRTGAHNVLEVSKAEFDACTQEKVFGIHFKGPATVPLTTPGGHYFYCGVGRHCEDGQKLSITVSSTPHPPIAAPGPDVTVETPTTDPSLTMNETISTDYKSSASFVSFSGSLVGLSSLLLSLYM